VSQTIGNVTLKLNEMNCERSQDLMLDSVFGLLDEAEANELCDHIAGCAACAIELERAKADQAKLARAALAIRDVEPFRVPGEIETMPATSPAPAMQPPAVVKRRASRSLIVGAWLGTIATCVAAVAILVSNHRSALSEQESRVAGLKRQLDGVDLQFAGLKTNFADEQRRMPEAINRGAVQLHVAGPGSARPGVSAGYHVALQDVDGAVKSGNIAVEWKDAEDKIVARQNLKIDGSVEVAAPPELAKLQGKVRMKVAGAVDGKPVGTIEESIAVRPQELAGHVAANKLVYKQGDRAQVRVLALDRVTLKPADANAKVTLSLVNDNGAAVVPPVTTPTLAGIAAAELQLPETLAEGSYWFEATGPNMPAVRRRAVVASVAGPSIESNTANNLFGLGKPIGQNVTIYNADGTPASNTIVVGNGNIVEQQRANYRNSYGRGVNNSALAEPRAPQQVSASRPFKIDGKTDENGRYEIEAPGVADAQSTRQLLQAEINFGTDKKNRVTFNREVRVQPSQVGVEFLPQGGQLIAGVKNRVYFRVLAPEGDAASARIAIHSSQGPVFDSRGEVSYGSFYFTPDVKERYTLKIVSPKQADIKDPFAKLGIRDAGILIGGDTMQSATGPIKLTLENRGGERLVQLVATCRGEIVAHSRTPIKEKYTPVELPVSVDGVIRVTAFEVKDGSLVPLSERLVMRPASRRLDVVVEPKGQDATPLATLSIKGRDEAKQPVAFWAMGCVTDSRFVGDVPEASPLTHFLLLGDAAADADLADLPALNIDGSASDIDLALGILGWRNVAAAAEAQAMQGTGAGVGAFANGPAMAKAKGRAPLDGKKTGERAEADRPVAGRPDTVAQTFFYRVEPSLAELRHRLETDWALAQNALSDAATKRQNELREEKVNLATRLAAARVELDDLQRRPMEQLQRLAVIGSIALLGLGIVGMVIGVVRIVRRRSSAMAFGTACACLAACLLLFMVFSNAGPQPIENVRVAEMHVDKLIDFPVSKPRTRLNELRPTAPQANSVAPLDELQVVKENPEADMKDGGIHAKKAGDDRKQFLRPGIETLARADQDPRLDRSRQALRNLTEAPQQLMAKPNIAANAPAERRIVLESPRGGKPEGAMSSAAFGGGGPKLMGGGGFAGGIGAGGGIGSAPPAPGALAPAATAQPAPAKAAALPMPMADALTGDAPPKKSRAALAPPAAPQPMSAPTAPATAPADVAKNEKSDTRDRVMSPKSIVEEKKSMEFRVDMNQLKRQFIARRSTEIADPATLLWSPGFAVSAQGTDLTIDLPPGAGRYRVYILGHTEDGRLGAYDGFLNAK
jgi:hypothetical protein